MSRALAIDLPPLAAWLARELPALGAPVAVEKFADGQSNPTYRLETEAGSYVLRRKPPGKLLASAHAIDREYRVMAALGPTPVPVPRVLHYCSDESVIGSEFFLMDYVPGRICWDPALPEVDAGERAPIHEATVRTLAALHAVDPDAVGLGDYGSRSDFLARQYKRWQGQYRAAETETIPGMEALMDWLPRHAPAETPPTTLVHGDYRLDNMIIAADAPAVLALLDWELSTLGNPLTDLAYLCVQLRLPADAGVFRGLGGLDRGAQGLPEEGQFLDWYAEATGRRVAHWDFYLAFCLFRLIAIVQGVRKRAMEGSASSGFAARVGELVYPMADLALAITGQRE
jgi:aminoglycoside phosphotransferase (APT) family kinase protein